MSYLLSTEIKYVTCAFNSWQVNIRQYILIYSVWPQPTAITYSVQCFTLQLEDHQIWKPGKLKRNFLRFITPLIKIQRSLCLEKRFLMKTTRSQQVKSNLQVSNVVCTKYPESCPVSHLQCESDLPLIWC
jgi:hypothetical protein